MIKTQNTQYKKTLRNELAKIGVDMSGFYFNDLCGNSVTQRRIKATVSRQLTMEELLTVAEGLSEAFGTHVDTKNYDYYGNTIVVYLRR